MNWFGRRGFLRVVLLTQIRPRIPHWAVMTGLSADKLRTTSIIQPNATLTDANPPRWERRLFLQNRPPNENVCRLTQRFPSAISLSALNTPPSDKLFNCPGTGNNCTLLVHNATVPGGGFVRNSLFRSLDNDLTPSKGGWRAVTRPSCCALVVYGFAEL